MARGLVGPHGGVARRTADGAKDRPHDVGQRGFVDPALGEILGGLPADRRHNARGELDPRHRQQAGGVGVSQPGAGAPAWRWRRQGSRRRPAPPAAPVPASEPGRGAGR